MDNKGRVADMPIFAAQPRFERGLDGSEPSGLPLADRAIV